MFWDILVANHYLKWESICLWFLEEDIAAYLYLYNNYIDGIVTQKVD